MKIATRIVLFFLAFLALGGCQGGAYSRMIREKAATKTADAAKTAESAPVEPEFTGKLPARTPETNLPVMPVMASSPTSEADLLATVCTGISTGRVNLRSCGSTRCGVLTTLPEGSPLAVLEPGDWYRVRAGDLTGWIYGKFVCSDNK